MVREVANHKDGILGKKTRHKRSWRLAQGEKKGNNSRNIILTADDKVAKLKVSIGDIQKNLKIMESHIEELDSVRKTSRRRCKVLSTKGLTFSLRRMMPSKPWWKQWRSK